MNKIRTIKFRPKLSDKKFYLIIPKRFCGNVFLDNYEEYYKLSEHELPSIFVFIIEPRTKLIINGKKVYFKKIATYFSNTIDYEIKEIKYVFDRNDRLRSTRSVNDSKTKLKFLELCSAENLIFDNK